MWVLRILISALVLTPFCLHSASAKTTGAVASVHPQATAAGEYVLQQGGNAVDAAVATALALGVVDSHNSGIGGGCFILAHRSDGRIIALDGREMAPGKAHRDMYLRDGKVKSELSRTGSLAVGVPGSLAAYQQLLLWGGTQDLNNLLSPIILLSEKGFPIGPTLAQRIEKHQAKIARFPATAAVFLHPDGRPKREGELLQQSDLGQSLRTIKSQGIGWFYGGAYAQRLDSWMKTHHGILRTHDFARYRVAKREPIRSELFQHTVIGFPPPSSGGTHVHQILTMIETSPLLANAKRSPGALYHLFAEAGKRAFADRAQWLGDPDFTQIPDRLRDRVYLAAKIAEADARQATPGKSVIPLELETVLQGHTTHLTVADQQGNWVSITTTLNTPFGSGVIIPGTGILLNNQMDDFSAAPGQPNAYGLVGSDANAIAPGKRPLSSMSPTLVLKDGTPVMALGAAGGPTIISQVSLALLRTLYLGTTLDEAIRAPRVHHQWVPDTLFVEDRLSKEMTTHLKQRGHPVKERKGLGISTGIFKDAAGVLIPVVDPRLLEQKR